MEVQEGCKEEGDPGMFRGDTGVEVEVEEEDDSRMGLERVEGEKWGGRKVGVWESSEQDVSGDDETED